MYRNENMVYNAMSIAGVQVLLSVTENQQLIITYFRHNFSISCKKIY